MDKDKFSLREKLILRILLFIVDWLSRSSKDIHNFEISHIMEEFELKKDRLFGSKENTI